MRLSTLLSVLVIASASAAQAPRFTGPFPPPPPSNPLNRISTFVIAGDFDGNRLGDALFANGGSATRAAMMPGLIATASQAFRISAQRIQAGAVLDIDGDRDLDLIVSDPAGFSVLVNSGRGLFTQLQRFSASSLAFTSIGVVDVDRDGDLDLVIATLQQNRLFLNNGGRFTDGTSGRMAFSLASTRAVASGDVNGDGIVDVFFGNVITNELWLGDGRGNLTTNGSSGLPRSGGLTGAELVDVDGDRDLDLIVQDPETKLWLNDGRGRFAVAPAGQLPRWRGEEMLVRDFTGDGAPDVVLFVKNEQAQFFENNGRGRFTNTTLAKLPARRVPSTSIATTDADNDGDLDLWIATSSGPDLFYENTGRGVFRNRVPVSDTSRYIPRDMATSSAATTLDIDADGDLDLIIARNGSQTDACYRNDGNGRFEDVTRQFLPTSFPDDTNAVEAHDLDGKGPREIITVNWAGNQQVRAYARFGASYRAVDVGITRKDRNGTSMAVGDIDGDKDLDLIVGNYEQNNDVYLNDGSGRFTRAGSALPSAALQTEDLTLVDIDGDGDLDLLEATRAASAESIRLYFNDGRGRFAFAPGRLRNSLKAGVASIATGDLDGDGDPDVFAGSVDKDFDLVFENQGKGARFVERTLLKLRFFWPDVTKRVLFRDVDGDEDLDVITVSQPSRIFTTMTNGVTRIYRNDSFFNFGRVELQPTPLGQNSLGAVCEDFDGDGDPDLFIANRLEQDTLHFNLARHVLPESRAGIGQTLELGLHSNIPLNTGSGQLGVTPLLGFANASIPIPGFGTLRVSPSNLIVFPRVPVQATSGRGVFRLPVPNNAALRGLTLYWQGLVEGRDVRRNLTLRLSNQAPMRIQ